MSRDKKSSTGDFRLEIPLDASAIEGFKPEQQIKVLVKGGKAAQSQTVTFDQKGHGRANFTFPEHPGPLHVIVGPANASDEELAGLQTLTADVSGRLWAGKRELQLNTIAISPYYWFWWLWWCREFVIRGRVVCPDGSPVPAATVCAYDVDWWFFFFNTQQVGCATTDINGSFEIRFRWCCGWWPWWWWRYRVWDFNPILADKIDGVLKRAPDLRLSPATGSQPSLAMFQQLLKQEGLDTRKPLNEVDPGRLDQIRQRLLQKLPSAPDLADLRIWPWWPWFPWWDCSPDIIFKVTQDCLNAGTVIFEDTIANTRQDIPNPLNVTLVANSSACCIPRCPVVPCPEGECLEITEICGDPINDVGGNTGAPVAPAGYLYPGGATPGVDEYDGDRPFAGIIPIVKNFGVMTGVDYYEIEMLSGINWVPLPAGAAVNFARRWMLNVVGFPTGDVPFNFVTIAGHNVVESKEHFEATGGLGGWGINRFWLVNEFLVLPLDTDKFADGTYNFRVVGWQSPAPGVLANRKVLPICGTEIDNSLVLTFDNRVITPVGHDPTHNCGPVHVCTTEPDTHIISVKINGVPVAPCATVDRAAGNLEIDFLVTDPDAHLAVYTLEAFFGLNEVRNLLSRPGASVIALNLGTFTGWQAGQGEGSYGIALSQGATAPNWPGGVYRLTVPASEAFPVPCCYLLELRGWKRNIVGYQSDIGHFCDHGYAFGNVTQYTIGVGECPTLPIIG